MNSISEIRTTVSSAAAGAVAGVPADNRMDNGVEAEAGKMPNKVLQGLDKAAEAFRSHRAPSTFCELDQPICPPLPFPGRLPWQTGPSSPNLDLVAASLGPSGSHVNVSYWGKHQPGPPSAPQPPEGDSGPIGAGEDDPIPDPEPAVKDGNKNG